ncbi:MAG: oleate hydratase [Bryobacteraceae bacterium]
MQRQSAGHRGLVTLKDSNWLTSIVLACQPHFPNQPAEVQMFWGYSLFPNRLGDFVPETIADCNGAEILRELCGHLHFDLDNFAFISQFVETPDDVVSYGGVFGARGADGRVRIDRHRPPASYP